MLVAVVLDADHDVLPTHVDVGECDEVPVVHQDLRTYRRQPRIPEQQTQPRLLGRLRAGVYKLESCTCPANAAHPGMS
ncbi:Uncharacterised protein [Mycobacteroides abscessus subsp. abscessus]|nr:Uncharacterised protein [Mycobacteroides abscessus subsp. abscessus]